MCIYKKSKQLQAQMMKAQYEKNILKSFNKNLGKGYHLIWTRL